MSARAALRAATAAKHAAVDAIFSRFDLTDSRSYVRFLVAHARVLPAIELRLAGFEELPPFAPRTEALRADLAALGLAMPEPLDFPPPQSRAAALGALYVIEGSRLGGVMLARLVSPDLPRAYLSAGHAAGAWRAFSERLDDECGGIERLRQAIAGAEAAFDLYARAAADAPGGSRGAVTITRKPG